MHEIGMHVNHNVDDFRPPFVSNVDTRPGEFDTNAHIDALTVCLTSSQEALDVFATIEVNRMRHLPTYYVAQTSYLAIVLTKLMHIVSAPHSRLGRIFKPEDLKVEHYLEKTANYLHAAGQARGGLIPARFAKPLEILRLWVKGRREGKYLDGWLPNSLIQTRGEPTLPIASPKTKRTRTTPHLGSTYYSYPSHTQAPTRPIIEPRQQAMESEALTAARLLNQSPETRNPPYGHSFKGGHIIDASLPTSNAMHITGAALVGLQSGYQNFDPSAPGHNTFISPARQSVPDMAQPYPITAHIDNTAIHYSQANDSTQPGFGMSTQDACVAQVLTLNLESEFICGQNMACWEDIILDPWYVASSRNFIHEGLNTFVLDIGQPLHADHRIGVSMSEGREEEDWQSVTPSSRQQRIFDSVLRESLKQIQLPVPPDVMILFLRWLRGWRELTNKYGKGRQSRSVESQLKSWLVLELNY
ncbi:hypothetical protein KEM54_006977 [Ascosphaera aggregata]|nr:hypothetical protein KEM54_006977 [Ascosphaera aggregata]